MECEEIGTAPHNGQQHRAGSGAAGTGQNVMRNFRFAFRLPFTTFAVLK